MTTFDRAWAVVKGKPPVEIEEEPHENESWIVGPEIDCQECGYGGNMSSLFDPRLGDIGLHTDVRGLIEARRKPR